MHIIRLRGPWELSRAGAAEAGVAHNLPATCAELQHAGLAGAIQAVRRFGLPTGLEAADVVSICLEGGPSEYTSVQFNGESLAPVRLDGGKPVIDITQRLQPRNELALTFSLADLPPETLVGQVQLTISPTISD